MNGANETIQFLDDYEDLDKQYNDSTPQSMSQPAASMDEIMQSIGATVASSNITNEVQIQAAINQMPDKIKLLPVVEATVAVEEKKLCLDKMVGFFEDKSNENKIIMFGLLGALVLWFIASK